MLQSIPDLWAAVVAGDAAAWEQLVRRYNNLVIAVARAHGLAASDLEDCAQQTWMALYSGRDRIKDPARVSGWLVRVAKRKAQRIQLKNHSRLSAESNFDSDHRAPSPEELYGETLESARIQTALELLDPRCRRLLARLFLSDEEWSYQEIAEQMGLSPNSLGPIRSRCLMRLRKILEELDPEPY
jgi:RNA polymerase sigma factor (sigma-70 family)